MSFGDLLLPLKLPPLLVGLLADARVPRRSKLAFFGAGLYFFSGIDLLPEMLLGRIGYLDDGVVILKALRVLICDTDEAVVLSHWLGDANQLRRLKAVLSRADDAVGAVVSRIVNFILRAPAVGRSQ